MNLHRPPRQVNLDGLRTLLASDTAEARDELEIRSDGDPLPFIAEARELKRQLQAVKEWRPENSIQWETDYRQTLSALAERMATELEIPLSTR